MSGLEERVPGNGFFREGKESIRFYDSLGGRHKPLAWRLRKYLQDEHKDKKGTEVALSNTCVAWEAAAEVRANGERGFWKGFQSVLVDFGTIWRCRNSYRGREVMVRKTRRRARSKSLDLYTEPILRKKKTPDPLDKLHIQN